MSTESDSEEVGSPPVRRVRGGPSGSGVALEQSPPLTPFSWSVRGSRVGPYGLWINTDASPESRRKHPHPPRFTREVLLRERIDRAFALFELTEAPALAQQEAEEASDAVRFIRLSHNEGHPVVRINPMVSGDILGKMDIENHVMMVVDRWMIGPQDHDLRIVINMKDLVFHLNIARARPEMYVTEAVAYGWQVYGFLAPRGEVSEVFVDFFYRCLKPDRLFTRELMGVLENGVLDEPLRSIIEAYHETDE